MARIPKTKVYNPQKAEAYVGDNPDYKYKGKKK